MTPERMAQIHADSFTKPRPWTAVEFSDLLEKPHIHAITHADGFAISSVVGGEAELLTLAVDPKKRRKGIARKICTDLEAFCLESGTQDIFLEVSEDNPNALALYESLGFQKTGLRKDYYLGTKGISVSAIVMKKAL